MQDLNPQQTGYEPVAFTNYANPVVNANGIEPSTSRETPERSTIEPRVRWNIVSRSRYASRGNLCAPAGCRVGQNTCEPRPLRSSAAVPNENFRACARRVPDANGVARGTRNGVGEKLESREDRPGREIYARENAVWDGVLSPLSAPRPDCLRPKPDRSARRARRAWTGPRPSRDRRSRRDASI